MSVSSDKLGASAKESSQSVVPLDFSSLSFFSFLPEGKSTYSTNECALGLILALVHKATNERALELIWREPRGEPKPTQDLRGFTQLPM